MSVLLFPNGLNGIFRLLTTTLVAGWAGSPMSWSPDSQWLSYTVAPGTDRDGRQAGWLFDTSREGASLQDPRGSEVPKVASGPAAYRIWTSNRDAESSVLIEASAWPLTSPSWSVQGRSVAFGRFVPASLEPHQTVPRGRLEVVIQQSLEQKRIVLTVPDFELGPDERRMFPHVAAVWSPDGQHLAFTKPGRVPAILIIKVESRRLIQTIAHAVMPAWSPDGSKLAFIRGDDLGENHLQVVERRGRTFTATRPPIAVLRVRSAPLWTGDSRSIFVVIAKAGPRAAEWNLERVSLETGEASRIQSLTVQEVLRRGLAIRGVAIDFDRQEERCFFSVDVEGRDTDVVWSIPREQPVFKRFHPVDPRLRIGSLTVSPDGRAVAVRFGPPGALTLPAVYDLTTDHTSMVIPDEAARGAWLAVLARTARALLLEGLPAATPDGPNAGRPTLLPLPGEISLHHSVLPRLSRLGRIGSEACNVSRRRDLDEPDPEAASAPTMEDRLFFDYLRGDFVAAETHLDALESRLVAPQLRLALLSLRAQILLSKGDTARARAVVEYLIEAEGGPIHQIEDTPRGLVLTAVPEPGQSWARYLASRINATESTPVSAPPSDLLPDHFPPDLPNPFAPPDRLEFRRERGGAIPFAPFAPGLDLGPLRRDRARPADRPPPQPQPVNPPRRRRVNLLRIGASERPAGNREDAG